MKREVSGRNANISAEGSPDSAFKFFALIFLFVNLLLILAAAIVLVATPMLAKNGNLCLTEQCVNTASRVLQAMDQSKDPCTDFYQYACGGWIKNHPIPDWTATWDRLTFLRETLMQDMRQLLQADDELQNAQPSAVEKAKALYRACMNAEILEKIGLNPVWSVLEDVGLKPDPDALGSSIKFDWLFTLARSRRLLGVNILYGLNVAEDVRNSSVHKIVVGITSERYLLQPHKFSSEIKYYKKYIVQMLNAYSNVTNGEKFADDIITFSTEIAKVTSEKMHAFKGNSVMTPPEMRRSSKYLFYEVTLDELSRGPARDNSLWKTVNWLKFLNISFADTNVTLNQEKDRVILLDLEYILKLSTLLANTEQIILEKFLWWNVFSSLAPLTLEKFRSLGFEFSRQLLGLQSRTPRWKVCTTTVNSNFGLALSYLYIRKYLQKNYFDKASVLLRDIKSAYEDAVYNSDWMDEVTREKTLTKLHAIREFVGYPGWILNATQLDNHYKQANVIEGKLFATYLNLTNAAVRRNLESIRKKPNRNRWVAAATSVNAFYSATLNSVTFPAGILKPPFYDNGIEAIDYGAIGAIMGHEITHGFDDQGRRYDEHGNLKQWWSPATLQHYHHRMQCIVEQYNNYSMPGFDKTFKVHGINTISENIADNGGLSAAFKGYKRSKENVHSVHQRLPGLEKTTTDQLFFLGFSQIWCGNSTTGALKSKLAEGSHSPNRIRVIGTLSNSEEFAKAWNCPIGSPMNPVKKCELW